MKLSWQQCKNGVSVLAYFAANLGHEWAGSLDAAGNQQHQQANALEFTDMAWQFFSTIHSK